jgi:hypothetical protein
MRPAATVFVVALLSACATSSTGSFSTPRASASGGPTPGASQLSCAAPVTQAHSVALMESHNTSIGILSVLDVSNPLHPRLLCRLSPADGGTFDQSPNQLLFSSGRSVGVVDLTSGTVKQTARLASAPLNDLTWSPDGSMIAYREYADDGRMSTHLYSAGVDHILYTQEPLGGHGGASFGPADKLAFSADGTLLSDFLLFRPPSGLDPFLVWSPAQALAGSTGPQPLFHSQTMYFGIWAPSGHTLYALDPGQGPSATGTLYVLADGQSQPRAIANGLSFMSWPQMSADGSGIVYDTPVKAGPNDVCGGIPHVWRIDLTSGRASQLMSALSSNPVFVTQTVLWAGELVPAPCGPGGESAQDGVTLAYDFTIGKTSTVDMAAIPSADAGDIVAAWF